MSSIGAGGQIIVQPIYQTATLQRALSEREIVADGLVHLIGVIAGIGGAAGLLVVTLMRGDPFEFAVISVYAAALTAMLGFSAAYNLVRCTRLRRLFYRFDHAAIFAMIAATYTPFTLLRMEGEWAGGFTALIWSVAGIGIALRLWHPRKFEPFFLTLYLALGWIGLIAFKPILASLGTTTLVLLAVGGALYSIGVIFHVWERLPFQRAVWHGFVLVAAGVHYAAVLNEVVLLHAAV